MTLSTIDLSSSVERDTLCYWYLPVNTLIVMHRLPYICKPTYAYLCAGCRDVVRCTLVSYIINDVHGHPVGKTQRLFDPGVNHQ